MIKSFSNKELENLFYDGQNKGINSDHIAKLLRILDRLDNSCNAKDMNYPGAKLHKLEPNKDNRWAISVSGNWRLTFIFKNGNAYEVNYLDYH
jgi:proteic killer suppression protein